MKEYIQIIYVSANDTAYASIDEARAITEGYIGGRFILEHQDAISTLTSAEIKQEDVDKIKEMCSKFGILPMFIFLDEDNKQDVCVLSPRQLCPDKK